MCASGLTEHLFFTVCCSIHLRSWSAQVAMATACVQSALYKGFSLSVSLWCLCSALHPETFTPMGSDWTKAGDANHANSD